MALKQAKCCLLGADRVYVCVPASKVSEATRASLERLGVGLVLFQHRGDAWHLKYAVPSRNRYKRPEYRRILRNGMGEARRR
jgi:hypothetical protein